MKSFEWSQRLAPMLLGVLFFAISVPEALAAAIESVRMVGKGARLWKDKAERTFTVYVEPPNTGDADRDRQYLESVRRAINEWNETQRIVYPGTGYVVRVLDPLPAGQKPDVTVKWSDVVRIVEFEQGRFRTETTLGNTGTRVNGVADVMGEPDGPPRDGIRRFKNTMVTIHLSKKVTAGQHAGEFRSPAAVERIFQHEFGHAEGLPDFYTQEDLDRLMYGRSSGDEQQLTPLAILTDPSVIHGKSQIHNVDKEEAYTRAWVELGRRLGLDEPFIHRYFKEPKQVDEPPELEPMEQLGVRLGGRPDQVIVPQGWAFQFVPDQSALDFLINAIPDGNDTPGPEPGWLYLFATDEQFSVSATQPFVFDVVSSLSLPEYFGRELYVVEANGDVSVIGVRSIPVPSTFALGLAGLTMMVSLRRRMQQGPERKQPRP